MLVTASADSTVKVWDTYSKNTPCMMKFQHLQGHHPHCVIFSPDEEILCSTDHYLNLWNMNTGQLFKKIHVGEQINSCCFVDDGAVIVSAAYTRGLGLWSVQAGKRLCALHDPSQSITSHGADWCTESPLGGVIASTHNNMTVHTVRLWDMNTQKSLRRLGHGESKYCCFAPDGNLIASTFSNGEVRLWDMRTQKKLSTLHTPNALGKSSFSYHGSLFAASCAYGHKTFIWDLRRMQQCGELNRGNSKFTYQVCSFSPHGFLATSDEGQINIYIHS